MRVTTYLLALFASIMIHQSAIGQVLKVTDLRVERMTNPEAIDTEMPQMSWILESDVPNTKQQQVEIRVAKSQKDLVANKNLVWTLKKTTATSINVNYVGAALVAGEQYFWQVRVIDNHGNKSAWSTVNYWRMGIKSNQWTAKWISAAPEDSTSRSPLFRNTYQLSKQVKSATAYVTARGLYEAFINGQRLGNACLTPGWTSYQHQLQYQVVDVSAHLHKGVNVIGATLGDGWYKGRIGFNNQRAFYGNTRALLLQIKVVFTDGSTQILGTDQHWKTSYGPILSSDIYDGEVYDARLEKKDWNTAAYRDSADWKPVYVADFTYENLTGMKGPAVMKHEIFKPQKIFKTPQGDLVVDFGQNLVGWAEITIDGAPGTQVTLHHAEVLDKAGNFYTTNLRSAKQENTYTVGDNRKQLFSPHFSFQGFRYVKVTGYPGELLPENIQAVTLYSDMEETGTFATSNPLINQLQKNIVWGQKGNFVDVPTDCPQRDERLGWTGDAQAFFNTAAFNMDVQGFFRKWLVDLKADQHANGSIPFVIPNVLNPGDAGAAGWADVATIIPWGMYTSFADTALLRQQYPSMQAWVNFMSSKSTNNLWNTGFHFGDWLFYRPDDDNDGRAAVTDKYLIAQCFYAHSVDILVKTATLLGRQEDAAHYRSLLENVKHAFQKEYLTPNGRLISSTQTAYVLALQFDMLPDALRQQAADRLVENIKSYGTHLTTGFLGTPYLCHVLSRFGHLAVAYELLLQESYPSWLYPVKMGATTIWERWDGIKPDGSFQTAAMNSYNHYAYGAIGDWMYKNIAGISALEPAYKKVQIAPQLGGELSRCEASLKTPYGKLSTSWTLAGKQFKLQVNVPANSSAVVVLPGISTSGKQTIEVGSGVHNFASTLP
ncbi:family 78 glycoside hydrolase catalytic domain [Sphingobacterium oryzagri]|uniref:alpha-L-rhamnosidase n=1 Tax=Sphingobacterium oryzagri TaxID=3025669 RepID=A0ABY7WGG2_9SPHI|nr:alpha-L-rhamnosidase [Sphingobacterium sp. KACC 22765]WDF67468.1 family 78 glycoside hydrolase catalytic domain [Sphingobacterium sp. KACC 22765]